MYTENDFRCAEKQSKLRLALLILLACVFFAGMILMNRLRIQAASMAVAGGGFVLVYFLWSFKVSPWISYNRYLREMKNGRKRDTECDFVSFETETRMRDGVEVHELIVKVGEEEEDERLFYWDADKKNPEFHEGDRLLITSYGNYVVDLKVL